MALRKPGLLRTPVAALAIGLALSAPARAEPAPPLVTAEPPSPLRTSPEGPFVTLGFGAGPLWAADPTLETGLHVSATAGVWPSPNLGFEVEAGGADLDDDYYGGELDLDTLIGRVVLSLPLASIEAGGGEFRWRVAAGWGRLGVDHTLTGVESEGVFSLQSGAEWSLSPGFRAYVLMDVLWGDIVLGDGPIFDPFLGGPAVPFWDLDTVSVLKFGVEFAF